MLGDNYTGPYWSDGKFQTSVMFGEKPPLTPLDSLSRLHDSAYARFPDRKHREAADRIYARQATKLGVTKADIAAYLVKYGNHTANSAENLLSSVGKGAASGGLFGALGGLLYGGVKNMWDLNDTLMNGDKYEKEISKFYATDPHPEYQLKDGKLQVDEMGRRLTPVLDVIVDPIAKLDVPKGPFVPGDTVGSADWAVPDIIQNASKPATYTGTNSTHPSSVLYDPRNAEEHVGGRIFDSLYRTQKQPKDSFFDHIHRLRKHVRRRNKIYMG